MRINYLEDLKVLQVPYIGGVLNFKDVAGVTHKYNTEWIEFHTPSEHVLDGVSSDLEMQIIHSKPNSTKRAVLTVLFSIVEEDVEKTQLGKKRSLDDSDVIYIPDPWAPKNSPSTSNS